MGRLGPKLVYSGLTQEEPATGSDGTGCRNMHTGSSSFPGNDYRRLCCGSAGFEVRDNVVTHIVGVSRLGSG